MESDEQSAPGASGGKEVRVHLRPAVRKELRRVLVTRDVYRSLAHAIRDYLDRSLLPRIEDGDYSSPRLAAELARPTADPQDREQTRVRLPDWGRVEEAARRVNRDLRRREEQVAWEGSLQGVPFCQVGPRVIVRAAAREIAELARGAPGKRYSREGTSGGSAGKIAGPGPGGRNSDDSDSGDGDSGDGDSGDGEPGVRGLVGRGPVGKEHGGEGPPGRRSDGPGPGLQMLHRLPGRERAGKLVMFCITAEAKEQLDRKAARLNQNATDLARRGTLNIIHWIDESPAEASEYIRAGSSLYWPLGERAEDRDYGGFQVRVAPATKRRLERARRRLEQIRESPGRRCERGPGRYASQKEILQAAARLALESEDMRPPLPGQGRAD